MTRWILSYAPSDKSCPCRTFTEPMIHSKALRTARWLMRKLPNKQPRADSITLRPALKGGS